MPKRVILVPLIALAAASCALDGSCPVGESRRAVIGGIEDSDPVFDAVVGILVAGGENFCSGALIAPRTVVAYASCVRDHTPSEVVVIFGRSIADPTATIEALHIHVHPGNVPDDVFSPQLVVLQLAEAAPGGVAPIPPLPASPGISHADEGSPVTFIGLGATTPGGTDAGVRRKVDSPISRVCNEAADCGGWTGGFAVDLSSGGPCQGDGPGFIQRMGTLYLAGVNYASDENCSVEGYVTSMGAMESFLAGVFGSCAGASDCVTGFCAHEVCCDSTCVGECMRCDLPASPGLCAPVEDGTPCGGGVCTGGVCEEAPDEEGEADIDAEVEVDADMDDVPEIADDIADAASDAGCDPAACDETCRQMGGRYGQCVGTGSSSWCNCWYPDDDIHEEGCSCMLAGARRSQ